MTDVLNRLLLEDRFELYWRRWGCRTDAHLVFSELARQYDLPKGLRHYHTLGHLWDCFRVLDGYFGDEHEAKAAVRDPDAVTVELALWFHDVIYDPTDRVQGHNERQSALFALGVMTQAGFLAEECQRVHDAILATTHIDPPQDRATAIVLDVDLSILGEPSGTFNAYCDQIRREYNMYPDHQFLTARKLFLQTFLRKPQLFHTKEVGEDYEKRARQNLQSAIVEISAAGF